MNPKNLRTIYYDVVQLLYVLPKSAKCEKESISPADRRLFENFAPLANVKLNSAVKRNADRKREADRIISERD